MAEQLPQFLARSRAPRTVAKYQQEVSRWEAWAESHKIGAYPAAPFHVVLYIMHRTQKAASPASVTGAVYGVAWAHHMRGLPNPAEEQLVKNALQSAKRQLARTPDRKKPITKSVIKRIFQCLQHESSLSDLQTATFIVLGYAGFFRWDDLHSIYADEIEFRSDYMVVFLESRKNDQLREGSWVVISRWGQGPLCPVARTKKLLKKGRHTGHAKLFGKVTKAKSGQKYLRGEMTYTRAREVVKEALARAGEDQEKYGLHSLRSGGVSDAAAAGVPDRLIRRHGGWRSETAALAYFKETLPNLMVVTKALRPN